MLKRLFSDLFYRKIDVEAADSRLLPFGALQKHKDYAVRQNSVFFFVNKCAKI